MKYEKEIFRQLTESIEENEKLKKTIKELRAENGEIKAENGRLRKRIVEIEETLEEGIKNVVNAAVVIAVEPLVAEIGRKDIEIKRLKSIIEKDSGNSNKPPSGDGFKKIPNNREKSEKKRGGQAGHKGSTLIIPGNLEELVREEKAEHKIVDMTNGSAKYISKWEIDIKTKVIYTEYRCPISETATITYGNDIKAYCAVLVNEGFMSLEKVSGFLREITYGQVAPSVATLEKFNREIAARVDIEKLKADILNGKVMNIDETPMRSTEKLLEGVYETSEKTTFDVIIRTHSNATTTLYTVNPRKDDEGIERDGIIPLFHGIFSHDHDRKYYKYGKRGLHAACCAHLSRELKGLSELYNISWAMEFRKFINEMNAYKETTRECPDDKFAEFERKYDDLSANGRIFLDNLPDSFGRDELRRMINRLTDYKQGYMLFVKNYKAPFTNNQAERDLRPCKTKQKVSGCFRSWDGLSNFAKIRSLISAAKKRSLNLIDTFSHLFYVLPCPR